MPRRAALRPRAAGAGRRAPAGRRGPRAHADRHRQPRRSSSSCAPRPARSRAPALVAAAFGLGVGLLGAGPRAGSSTAAGTREVMLPLAGLHARVARRRSSRCGLAGAPTGALVACGLAAGRQHPAGRLGRAAAAGAACSSEDAGPAAHRLRARRHRDRARLRHRAAAHRGDRASSPRRRSRSLVACGFVVLGTLVLVTRRPSRAWRPDAGDARAPPARRAAPRRACARIVAATAPVGFALGATEVTMTAFAADHGSRAAAGALHGGVGGGQRRRRPDLRRARARRRRRARAGCAWPSLFPLCSLPLAAGPVDRRPWRRWR